MPRRQARIMANSSYGATLDAYHITAPAPEGKGGQSHGSGASGSFPEQIDYINAHGTSTEYNVLYETKAIKHIFGERLQVGKFSKVMIGHLLGAAGWWSLLPLGYQQTCYPRPSITGIVIRNVI